MRRNVTVYTQKKARQPGERFRRACSARDATAPSVREKLRERGFFSPEAVADWPLIAGPELAACTAPLRITARGLPGGAYALTLYVALFRAPMAMQLQMAERAILEKTAAYLGRRSLEKMVIKHFFDMRPPAPANAKTPKPPRPEQRRAAAELYGDIADPVLRERLAALADRLYGKE